MFQRYEQLRRDIGSAFNDNSKFTTDNLSTVNRIYENTSSATRFLNDLSFLSSGKI